MNSYQLYLPCYEEEDGKLCAFEPPSIPGFLVNRIFYIFDVPTGEDRANHACMNASTVFIAIAGSVTLSVENDGEKSEYLLAKKNTAVFVPMFSWIRAYNFSKDAVLIGMSDRRYQDCQYINDYRKYLEIFRKEK